MSLSNETSAATFAGARAGKAPGARAGREARSSMGRPAGVRKAALVALIAAVTALLPKVSLACATCFGAPDSNLTRGTSNGVWFMIGIVVFVQLGFVALFFSFWRRARALQRRRESFRLLEGGSITTSHSRHF